MLIRWVLELSANDVLAVKVSISLPGSCARISELLSYPAAISLSMRLPFAGCLSRAPRSPQCRAQSVTRDRYRWKSGFLCIVLVPITLPQRFEVPLRAVHSSPLGHTQQIVHESIHQQLLNHMLRPQVWSIVATAYFWPGTYAILA